MVDKLNKINKATGYKSEKLFWTDVKNKFENAYKQDYQGNNTKSRFSIQTDSKGNKYVRVYTDQNIFENVDENEYVNVARKYILENYRDDNKSISLPTAEEVTVTRKTANEYTYPKNKLPKATKASKMRASTELDNLIKISEYQYSSKDDGRHSFARDGWDYYKTIFEVDGEKFEGLVNIAKSGNKKTLYDITNIKRISQNYSASDKSFSVSLTNSNNRISPSGEDVNTTTKYSMQESGNNSVSKNNNWQTYLDKNYKNTGTGRTVQDVKIAPTAKNELNKVAKNQETLYNNESESGMNEQIQQSRLLESNNGLSRFSKENINQENRKYTRTEFEDWEKSIKPITESKLSNEQRQIKEDFKRQYNKDIVFFDGKNNKKGYSAGASYTDSKRINIDINQAKEFRTNKIIYHEVMESNILHNLESNRDIIEPALQKIINDSNFEKQKTKFWQGQDGAIPNDYLIAKELLCDRYAEMKTGKTWDYDNILSQETNMTIDFAIENFEKQLKNSSTKLANNIVEKNKTLNPVEISNLNRKDANTTPELKNKTYEKGNKQTSFLSNITTDAKFLNEDLRQVMSKDENIQCLDMI